MKEYYVYIMASRYRGATYIGMTSDLDRRVMEHRSGDIQGYTKKWNIKTLVYFEEYRYVDEAISREKELKKWKRQWKYDLIESTNPDWKNLFD